MLQGSQLVQGLPRACLHQAVMKAWPLPPGSWAAGRGQADNGHRAEPRYNFWSTGFWMVVLNLLSLSSLSFFHFRFLLQGFEHLMQTSVKLVLTILLSCFPRRITDGWVQCSPYLWTTPLQEATCQKANLIMSLPWKFLPGHGSFVLRFNCYFN